MDAVISMPAKVYKWHKQLYTTKNLVTGVSWLVFPLTTVFFGFISISYTRFTDMLFELTTLTVVHGRVYDTKLFEESKATSVIVETNINT